MITHQALKLLHEESDTLSFLTRYLGDDVIESLPERARPININANNRELLRKIIGEFSRLMPQADHVVRRDVRGGFAMYVGFKSPGGAQRGHYVYIELKEEGLLFTIGGSPDPKRREEIANEHECTKALNGLAVSDEASFNKFYSLITQVATVYNPLIRGQKGGVAGWTPAISRLADGSKILSGKEAIQLISEYCRPRRQEMNGKLWDYLIQIRDSTLVPAVQQGLPAADAVKMAIDAYLPSNNI